MTNDKRTTLASRVFALLNGVRQHGHPYGNEVARRFSAECPACGGHLMALVEGAAPVKVRCCSDERFGPKVCDYSKVKATLQAAGDLEYWDLDHAEPHELFPDNPDEIGGPRDLIVEGP